MFDILILPAILALVVVGIPAAIIFYNVRGLYADLDPLFDQGRQRLVEKRRHLETIQRAIYQPQKGK